MEKRKKYNKYDSGKTFFLSVIVPQLVAMVFVIAVMLIANTIGVSYDELIKYKWVLALSAILAQVSFVGVFFRYNAKNNINYLKATGFCVKTTWRNYLGCIIIAVVALFGFNNLIGVFDQLIVEIGYKGSQSMPLPLNNVGWLFYNLVFLALAPAVFEEFLFRGIIFNGLKKQGKVKAVFVSAVLFMLMHGSVVQTVYPLLLGTVLGFVMMKTENVFCTMLIHFLNNAIVIVINFVSNVNNISSEPANMLTFKNVSLSILYALIAGVIIYLIIRFILRSKQKKNISLNNIEIEETPEIDFAALAENNQELRPTEQNGLMPNRFMTYGLVISVVIYLLDVFLGFM